MKKEDGEVNEDIEEEESMAKSESSVEENDHQMTEDEIKAKFEENMNLGPGVEVTVQETDSVNQKKEID